MSFLLSIFHLSLFFSLCKGSGYDPVISSDFPDPSILRIGGKRYALLPQLTFGRNYPLSLIIRRGFPDDQTWTLTNIDALPVLGSWATSGKTWAPDVLQRSDGTFVMYYTAPNASSISHRVGTATSTSPTGPYTPQSTPLACADSGGGALDPAGFQGEDGMHWVVYKVDGNALGGGGPCGNDDGSHSTPIHLQRLADDAVTPVGDPVTILDRSEADGPAIQGPSLIKRNGLYVLSFSSNCVNTLLFDTSYATATSISGPYTKAAIPLLVTGQFGLTAPGGADLALDGNSMVFHGNVGSGRGMYTAQLSWNGNVATVQPRKQHFLEVVMYPPQKLDRQGNRKMEAILQKVRNS
ncbi:glycoside hydrolase family 43 protein [Sphaerobolus stellatus SS14]|uniref:Glycoside hydrolase family 43 protein n=1 Tax=Sphaerobolus stellatus (strain SS14) TaxID=990650 RepID=A0A0C9UCH7_SPHS4|nr:glycoside hydrolase family 43 protein [Sphaerobolus stellatus SS14]